jgi:AcrR family transcriptional regulator
MAGTGPRAGSLQQRRARIEDTALELFATRGFDRVTVTDVCAGAGVAPATFYRHFGSKEEVVFAYQDDFRAALTRALDAGAQVAEEARLAVVVQEYAAFLDSQQDVLTLRDRIVVGHPRLLQRTLLLQRELEGVLATGLARLRGAPAPDRTALLEAGVGFLVLRLAVRSWRTGTGRPLLAETQQTLADLRGLLSTLPASPPDPAPGS